MTLSTSHFFLHIITYICTHLLAMLAPTFGICYICEIFWFGTVIIPVRLLLLWSLRSQVQADTMAFSQLIFSSALNFHLLCFCSSSTSIVKVGALWGIIFLPGSLDTAGSNLKTPFLHKFDLPCPCRVPYLDSWHVTRTQTKRFLSAHWLYSSNGTASFNPSILENTLSSEEWFVKRTNDI